jgi:M6 family metalloprotease-like protein
MSNPDGSRIELRLVGDEYFSYATDLDGVNIYEKNSDGFWVKATLNGAELLNVPTDIERYRKSRNADTTPAYAPANVAKYADVDANGQSKFPTLGDNHFLIVLMQYSDVKFSMDDPQEYYTNWANQENFEIRDHKGSARDFYVKTSDGKFTPTFDVSPVVTLPYTSSYYVGGNKYARYYLAIQTALDTLDANGFDFSIYDADNDGYIDNIYFIYAGFGQADTGDTSTIWPHKSNLSYYGWSYDGKTFGAYATGNELAGQTHYYNKDGAIDGVGTFCHEFGHVLGLPDLYDTEYKSTTDADLPGDWTTMCNGTYNNDGLTPPEYTAYEKWVCKWIDYEVIEDGHYSLESLARNARGIKLPILRSNGTSYLANEYYVFETRNKEGWDAYLPGEGMLIWHIDFSQSIWTSNTVNNTAGRPRCTIQRPSGNTVAKGAWPGSGIYGNFLAPGYTNSFSPNGNAGAVFQPSVTNITYADGVTDFDYQNGALEYSEVASNLNYCKRESPNDTKGFILRWDAAPEATNYAITIRRYNSSGNSFVVDNYNEKTVGNVLECLVNESEAMMKQSHTITIRAINGIPSSEVLTVEGLVPTNFSDYTSGVAEIVADDAEIYGAEGRVVAPVAAKVYNLSGMETTKENLPAGIYLVRYANKTVKVVVK